MTMIRATAAATLAIVATAAWADTTDLVVHCDPALAGPLIDIAARFRSQAGIQARLFPTTPNAILAQMARQIQNDIVISEPVVLEALAARGQIAGFPPSARWRDRLVITANRGGKRQPIEQSSLAAPDPVWGGGPDGPKLLSDAGAHPGRLIGTYGTDEARTLLRQQEVDYALLHASELTGDLEAIDIPGLTAARIMTAAVTTAARRPHPEVLLQFLGSPEATAIFRAHGLEPA
jgi:ABC-type molybdate transport system substrate-binding protein